MRPSFLLTHSPQSTPLTMRGFHSFSARNFLCASSISMMSLRSCRHFLQAFLVKYHAATTAMSNPTGMPAKVISRISMVSLAIERGAGCQVWPDPPVPHPLTDLEQFPYGGCIYSATPQGALRHRFFPHRCPPALPTMRVRR